MTLQESFKQLRSDLVNVFVVISKELRLEKIAGSIRKAITCIGSRK